MNIHGTSLHQDRVFHRYFSPGVLIVILSITDHDISALYFHGIALGVCGFISTLLQAEKLKC